MLALVDNIVARIEPVLDAEGGFSVRVEGPFKGQGKVNVLVGDDVLVSGVTYYKMEGVDARIDPRNGRFTYKKGQPTRFRAVFNNQHQDVQL